MLQSESQTLPYFYSNPLKNPKPQTMGRGMTNKRPQRHLQHFPGADSGHSDAKGILLNVDWVF